MHCLNCIRRPGTQRSRMHAGHARTAGFALQHACLRPAGIRAGTDGIVTHLLLRAEHLVLAACSDLVLLVPEEAARGQ